MASENEGKRETLADIVSDMREAGALMPAAYMRDLLNYAERIEAIDSADAWRSLYAPPVGNAAAMRDELVKIYKLMTADCPADEVEIANICFKALSAPARNCDLYATYAEAAEAHKEYATAYIMRASNKFDFPMEFDEWLFAPAAERKGEGDGK